MGLGGQRSRRVRHLGTTWRRTTSAYAVRLLPSTQVARLVGAPLNKNAMEHQDAQARGAGKVPSFKGRKAYLSRQRTTRRAKSCRRLSRGCLRGTDRPRADFARTGAHVAHVHAWVKQGDAFETRPFYDRNSESWSDSEGIPWGFHSFQTVGIPLRTPVILQSHRASWVRLGTITTRALCLEDMM
jgi:hypothetical protein